MNKTELRKLLLSDPLLFTQYFFKMEYNREFYPAEPHRIIAEKLKDVLTLKTTRLIINIAPRFGKTELIVKMLMALGLAFNPKSKFIHASYSEKLALDNSESVRDLIKSKSYQDLFDIETKKDSDSKSKWYTKQGGGVYATSTGGQITGFGAGSIDSEYFSGALIIDDPIKPESALSMVTRDFVNERFDNTLRSRLNSEKTPIIIVMQRLHANDLTGFLLEKEREKWELLVLPALKEDGKALWEMKLSAETLIHLRKITPYVFYSQYQQTPKNIHSGGEFLKSFSVDNHVKPLTYDFENTLHISIDSNVMPYIAVSVWQIKKVNQKYFIRQIHELPARDPINTARKSGKYVADWLKEKNYNQKIYLYGDPTTKARNNIDDNKKSFYDLFTESIKKEGYTIIDKFFRKAPPVASTGDFINHIFDGGFENMEIEINETCKESINDYIETKEDKDGGILKRRITDPKTKQSYEPNGHILDSLRYFICKTFEPEFKQFLNRFSDYSDNSLPDTQNNSLLSGF